MPKHRLIKLVTSKPVPPVASPVEIRLVFAEPRGLEGSPSSLFRSTFLDVGAYQPALPGEDIEDANEPESEQSGGAS
jgi:hypothetical protein